jgi:hypothetical protein
MAEEKKPRTQKMSDQELLALIGQYEKASLGSQVAAGATISTTTYPSNQAMTTLEIDRYNALNAYLARPLGNEVENRSQVVMPTLRDTMSWMMPQLMRMFASAKSICRFDPENQADEKQAEMETLTCNHVFMQQNNGIIILHDLFHDGLLMRNGYAEVETQECTEVREEKYSGLDAIELAALMQDTADEELEPIEQTERLRDVILPLPQTGPGGPPQQVVQQVPVYDVKFRRKQTRKECKVTCLPPEEMRVTPRAREGMEGIVFAMHQTQRARSDLIKDGYDKAQVNSLPTGRPNWLEIDALARNQVVDQMSVENPSDFAMQEVELRKAIVMVDYDGDGIAELRRVIIGGGGAGAILENEMIEETPFVSTAAIRMPHRHTGMSVYDLVMDLQIIQTALWRSGLDNFTIANNVRYAVDWTKVNVDDLLTSRPGGAIRGQGPPSQWIEQFQGPTDIMGQALEALAYVDQLRSNRTGIGKGTMGLDADELQNVTKGGQLAALSAASLILELIARMLAEGVKGIFLKIHSELIRHQDKPLELEIAGQWVNVDPSSWRRRTKVTPNVGLGSGNREEMRANVGMLVAAQEKLAQVGLVGPKQAYESFKLVCESLGFTNPERFAIDPNTPEFQKMMANRPPQPPAPQVQAAQIRAQTEQSKQQSEDQRSMMKMLSELIQQRRQGQQDQIANLQQLSHDAVQQHRDREVQLDSQHLQILLKLIPAIAQVLAAEKAAPDELGSDVNQAASTVE